MRRWSVAACAVVVLVAGCGADEPAEAESRTFTSFAAECPPLPALGADHQGSVAGDDDNAAMRMLSCGYGDLSTTVVLAREPARFGTAEQMFATRRAEAAKTGSAQVDLSGVGRVAYAQTTGTPPYLTAETWAGNAVVTITLSRADSSAFDVDAMKPDLVKTLKAVLANLR